MVSCEIFTYVQASMNDSVHFWLVVEPTQLKNISQNGNLHPNRDENQKYLKPPARFLSDGKVCGEFGQSKLWLLYSFLTSKTSGRLLCFKMFS